MANEVKLKLSIDGGQAVNNTIDGVSEKFGTLDGRARDAAAGSDTLSTALKGLATVGTAMAIIKMADSVTTLQTQLRLSSGTAIEASKAYAALFDIAQQSRVSFTELGTTYAAIARSGREMGVSQDRLLNVTKAISQAMTIGGGSAASMQAALVQLGQGLSSGTLRGEELNSIMEQTPRLAKALADGLGVPIGELRKLGETGQLTSQQVISALEKAGPALTKEMSSATLTVGQAFTMLSNSAVKFVGEADSASGASSSLANALKGISAAIDTVGAAFAANQGIIQTVMGSLAGAAALTTLAAIPRAIAAIGVAVTGLSAVLMANPIVLTLLGVGAVVGGVSAAINVYSKTADGIKSTIASLEEANLRSEQAMQRALDGGRVSGADNIKKTIEDRKKAVRELTAELALMGSAGVDNRAEEARLAAGTAATVKRKQSEAELLELRQKLSGVDKDYLPTLTKLNQQYQDGNLSLAEYRSLVGDLAKKNFKEDATASKALSDAAKTKADNAKADIAAFHEMDKLRTKSQGDEMKRVADLAEAKAKAEAKATESYIKQLDARAIADADVFQMAKDYGQTVDAANARTQVEIGLMSETAAAREIALSQYDIEIKLQQKILDIKSKLASLPAQDEAIAAATAAAASEKAAVSSRVYVSDLSKSVQQYDTIFRDGFAGMINGGKGAWKSFTTSLATTFKTSVADQIYKSFAQPFVVKFVASMLGITGAGSAIASEAGGGIASSIGLSAAISKAGAYVAEGASTVATAILGFGADALAFEGGLAMMGSATGLTSFMAGAGQAMAAMGPVGWAALAAVAVIAAMGLEGGETRSGGYYGYSFDGQTAADPFNGATGRADVTRAASSVGSLAFGGPSGGNYGAKEVKAAIDGTVVGINATLKALGSAATVAGFQAAYETSENDRGGALAGGTLSTGATFGQSGNGSNYAGDMYDPTKGFNLDTKGALSALTLELKQAYLEALQVATDIPATVSQLIADSLNGADVASLSAEATQSLLATVDGLIQKVTVFGAAMDLLPFERLKTLSFDATAGLLAAAGGFDVLAGNLGGFYQGFFTAEEQRAQSITNTSVAFEALGLTMPTLDEGARAAYKAMVLKAEAELDGTDATAKAYAGLLALQGPMNQLAPTFDSIAQAAVDAVAKMQSAVQSAQSVAVQMGLTTSYAVAQSAAETAYQAAIKARPGLVGYTQAEIVNFASDPSKRGELDASTWGVIDNLVVAIGAWDTAQTAERNRLASTGSSGSSAKDSYSTPANDTSIADAIAQITKGLTDAGASLGVELLKAQGKTVEAMAAQRAIDTAGYNTAQIALYDYNQTLRDQIAALGEASALQARIASERAGLQTQYDELTMSSTQLLAKQRAGLDESNRALFDSIELIKSKKVADAEATKTAETQLNWQNKLDVLMGTSTTRAQALQRDLASTTDASTQALIRQVYAQEDYKQALAETEKAMDAVKSARQRIADLEADALQATEQAATESAQKMRDLGKSLREFVNGQSNLPNKAFAETLQKALAGDKDAMQGLSSAATAASDLAQERASNVALAQARIMADVMRVAILGEGTALPTASTALDPMALAQRTLDLALAELRAINGSTAPLVAQIVNGFAGIDLNVDGMLTLAELKAAGLASDATMTNIFNQADTNGDGMLTKLEAIRANTLLTATNIGAATTAAIIATNTAGSTSTEMGLAGLTSALRTSATAQGVDQGNITASFASGLFSQLDANGSGGLSTTEASSSKISAAVATFLTQTPETPSGGGATTTTPVASLSAYDNMILADAKYKLGTVTNPVEQIVSDAYQSQTYRKPEQAGLDYWEGYYNQMVSAGTGAAVAEQTIRNYIRADAVARSVTGATAERQSVKDSWIGSGMTELGAGTVAARYFANGGAFTNGIVSSPTNFNMGQMGEAGPEAIMPLTNINGSLGVRFAGNSSNDALVAEIRALRKEVAELRQSNTRENVAIASHAANTADSTRKLAKDGVEVWTDPASPINTKVAA